MEFGLSGLSVAMRILNRNQEVFKHSFSTARTCKKVMAYLPKDYLSISPNNICLAALYHDLGKANWPEKWFYLEQRDLAKGDMETMKTHPLEGARLLKNLVPGIPKEIIKLIREHHERPNGEGYPLKLKRVSNETLFLAACDVYCACIEPREYRKKIFTKAEALDIVAEFAPVEIIQAFMRLEGGCCEVKTNF